MCKLSSITPVLKDLQWLPVEHLSGFKTVTLVYKFLHPGLFQYFDSYLQLYSCDYNTRCCQNVGKFLIVPKFQPSVHKSGKELSFSFAFDAPTLWNDLADQVLPCPMIGSFRQKLKAYFFNKASPPQL